MISRRGPCAMAVAALVLNASASAAQAGDPNAGREVFKKCAVCHRLEPNRNAVGPSLYGVIGRKAGSVAGYSYSKALKAAEFVWTPEQLDQWLRNPKSLVPGNKMPFPGLPESNDRASVIEFLRRTSNGAQ